MNEPDSFGVAQGDAAAAGAGAIVNEHEFVSSFFPLSPPPVFFTYRRRRLVSGRVKTRAVFAPVAQVLEPDRPPLAPPDAGRRGGRKSVVEGPTYGCRRPLAPPGTSGHALGERFFRAGFEALSTRALVVGIAAVAHKKQKKESGEVNEPTPSDGGE